MTTLGSVKKDKGGRLGKSLVLVAVAGAVVFGGYLGYLAWSNGSFPVQQRPFEQYATVVSADFNGTDYSFAIRWANSSYLPLYAQLYSATDNAADSPVCDLQRSSVATGEVFYLPFGTSSPEASLSNVELYISVKPLMGGGGDFTIVHRVTLASAVPGNVYPSEVTCAQSGVRV